MRLRRITPRSPGQMPPSHLARFPPLVYPRRGISGGKRGSDAGLAAPLISRERLQAPLASAVTAALTPCRVRDPGLLRGRFGAERGCHVPSADAVQLPLAGSRGGCSGVAAFPRGEAAPRSPPSAGGLLGGWQPGTARGLSQGKGGEGLCPLRGLLSVSHTRAGEHLAG